MRRAVRALRYRDTPCPLRTGGSSAPLIEWKRVLRTRHIARSMSAPRYRFGLRRLSAVGDTVMPPAVCRTLGAR